MQFKLSNAKKVTLQRNVVIFTGIAISDRVVISYTIKKLLRREVTRDDLRTYSSLLISLL